MSIFNNKGEMNASNLQDALQTIAKYASVIEEGASSNFALAGAPSLTDAQRDSLIERAVMTHEGKVALAQVMANPIK